MFQQAKIKSNDLTSEEYEIRKDKFAYTFHPLISKARPKSSQSGYKPPKIKGENTIIQRYKIAQQVYFSQLL